MTDSTRKHRNRYNKGEGNIWYRVLCFFFFEMGRGCVNYKIICPLVIFSISIYAFFTIWGQDPHILQDSQQHKHKQNAHYTKSTSNLNGCVCVVWVEVRMMMMMSTRVSLLIQSHTHRIGFLVKGLEMNALGYNSYIHLLVSTHRQMFICIIYI